MAGTTPVGKDAHPDTPLANKAIKAFQSSEDFIAKDLSPIVPVNKQNDKYYVIDPDSWLRIANTARAPMTEPNEVTFRVSSDGYFCDNYALRSKNSLEDLANADTAIQLRENSALLVTEMLQRDYENRVANMVTSGTNLGSYVTLSGNSQWSDYVNSDPVGDVRTGHSFIRGKTGIVANTLVVDYGTSEVLRSHPALMDMYKYTVGGLVTNDQLKAAFQVKNLLIGKGVKNNAHLEATASITNIWGNNAILAHVQPGLTAKTATFSLSYRWKPAGAKLPMQALRYLHPDSGVKAEYVEVGMYQDEKIVAKDLSYGILSTVA
jgi:hypothetical protein